MRTRLAISVFVFAACAKPAPTPVAEEASKEEAAIPGLQFKGPITFVDHAEILYAQRQLARRDEVLQMRLDRRGDLRTLSLTKVMVAEGEPFAMALAAIDRYKTALGVERMEEWVLDRALEDGAALHVRVQQVHDGVAVDDRQIDVHFLRDGSGQAQLTQITGSGAAIDAAPTASVSSEAAITAARARLAPDGVYETTAALRFFRGDDGVYRLAHRVDVNTADHTTTRSIYVDAATGAVIAEHDRLAQAHVQAFVYPHNSTVGDREWLPMANLSLSNGSASAVTDKNGNHSLSGDVSFIFKGPFVEAIDEDASAYQFTGSGNASVEFGRFDKKNGALAVFVHVNRIHDWFFDTFGYQRLNGGIKAYVHVEDCLFNAYAHGTSYLRFGDGCGLYDYAQNADYVFHEYTHLVTNSIVDVDYSTQNEAGAFSEGNSDYFACTALDNDVWGENPIGVFERPCNNTKRYEKDYSGEAHSGAPLYSGSVWELRKQFGKSVADTVAYYGMFYMPKHPMLIDTRDALMAADREKFAGAHVTAIQQAFDKHGINDALQVFITTDNRYPKMLPFEATLTAHAQGFDRHSVKYEWEFGDGTTAAGDEVYKKFTKKPASAKVTVSDATGTKLFAEVTLSGCNAAGEPWPLALVGFLLLALRRRRR